MSQRGVADRARGLLGAVEVNVGDHDARAGCRERARDGLADAFTRTRDECYLAREASLGRHQPLIALSRPLIIRSTASSGLISASRVRWNAGRTTVRPQF